MRGASMRAVSELRGHHSMQMTMRYAYLTPGYLSTEVSLLDGIGQTPKGKKRATISSVDTVQHETIKFSEELGAPSTTRTCDLLVRSQTLYPTELWAQT